MSSARLQGTDPVMLAGVEGVLTDRLVARPNIKSIEELRETHWDIPFWSRVARAHAQRAAEIWIDRPRRHTFADRRYPGSLDRAACRFD